MFILPFDHRASFGKIIGLKEPFSFRDRLMIKKYKRIVFDGFLKVYNRNLNLKKKLAILVDEQYGKRIIQICRRKKINFLVTQEKSGQEVFDFEYGDNFKKHLVSIRPSYAKVLVRYNAENKKSNKIQLARLLKMSKFCEQTGIGLLFELLVPPTAKQLKKCKNNLDKYNKILRPKLTLTALKEITDAGIWVDVWKLEPQLTSASWKNIIALLKKQQTHDVEIVVLGQAGSKSQVKSWLRLGRQYKEVIGFAVGRTIFVEPLEFYRDKKISRKKAVNIIADEFECYVDLWLNTKVTK